MLGAVIGGYRLISTLGEGGMGAVYLGEHLLLGRRAAIKVLLPALSSRQDIVHRFFNEARAVTQIADPGIVQVFDFGYHGDGSAYLVMEVLDGEALDTRLRRLSRLSPVETLRIGRQLASSLAAAHGCGVVHRDLKPDNVFLVADREVAGGERVKILDFGIAKLTAEAPGAARTLAGVLMGTPHYMSPEQCRGSRELDHRSDIYALGCVLFHMLTGRPPFAGDGIGEIIARHLRETPPPPSALAPGVAPVIDDLVLRCLAKSPADRFASMVELSAALGGLLQVLAPGTSSGHHAVPYQGTITGPWLTPPPPAPTTLGGSAGAIAAPIAAPIARRRAGAALAVAAFAAVAIAMALRSGGGAAPPAATAPPAVAAAAVPAAVTRVVGPVVDTSSAPIDAGVIDAGVVDAGGGEVEAIDAGVVIDARASSRAYRRQPAEPADARCARDDLDCDGIPDER